jgi:hypothetical protein
MVEQPYYQAEMASGGNIGDTPLADAINQLGEQRADRRESKYDYGPDRRGHYEIEIGSWASGPLLYLEAFDTDGETKYPTIDKRLTETIFRAGYAPSSFRPEKVPSDDGGREHSGRWMWYLLPLEDVQDEDSSIFASAYAIQFEDGTFLRGDDDADLVKFDKREFAEAVARESEDGEVVEVNN